MFRISLSSECAFFPSRYCSNLHWYTLQCDCPVCCQFGQTALKEGANHFGGEIVPLLLNHGANVNDQDYVCVYFSMHVCNQWKKSAEKFFKKKKQCLFVCCLLMKFVVGWIVLFVLFPGWSHCFDGCHKCESSWIVVEGWSWCPLEKQCKWNADVVAIVRQISSNDIFSISNLVCNFTSIFQLSCYNTVNEWLSGICCCLLICQLGQTTLMFSVILGCVDVVQLLLSNGANINYIVRVSVYLLLFVDETINALFLFLLLVVF